MLKNADSNAELQGVDADVLASEHPSEHGSPDAASNVQSSWAG